MLPPHEGLGDREEGVPITFRWRGAALAVIARGVSSQGVATQHLLARTDRNGIVAYQGIQSRSDYRTAVLLDQKSETPCRVRHASLVRLRVRVSGS